MMIVADQKASDIWGAIRRLWDYLRRQKTAVLVVILLVCINMGLELCGPYLMGKAIDDYILPGDLPGLVRILLLMLGIYAAAAAVNWIQAYVMAGVSQRAVRDIRDDLFARVQTLPLRFFDARPHGELMSRLTNDVENISMVLSQGITQLVSSVLSMAGIAVAMLLINVPLALVSLLSVPLMAFLTKWISKRTLRGFREQQQVLGEVNGLIEETVTGGRVVKAFGREQTVVAEFDAVNRRLQAAATRAQTFALALAPLTNFINNLGFVIVVLAGGWMAVQGLVTIGIIATFISYTRRFGRPLNQIANLYNSIQGALAGAERVFEVLDETPEADAPDADLLKDVKGDVAFVDVSFGYETDVPVLKHVRFHAEPGRTVALVGPTGAGKTTIVNLLTRFYDVDDGSIAVDGHDIRSLNRDDLRRRLGIVLQDTFLFSASVMDNIRYGRLDATDDEVIAAARLANADQFIHRLPQGYATPLSERGGNLSQGQRQLLAVARAVLADPEILILDEATSSIDTRTEIHIQEAMLRLMVGRTSFVIAHRLSTIRRADNIIVINNGEIVEQGTHSQLLDRQGFYHRLYMSQFKGMKISVLGPLPRPTTPPNAPLGRVPPPS